MKKIAIAIIIFMLQLIVGYAKEENTIVLGIAPWADREKMLKEFKPLVDYFAENLNKKVVLTIVDEYVGLGEAVNSGEIDIGILPSSAYVKAKNLFPELQYLCTPLNYKTFKDSYASYIFVRKDSGIKKYQDLKGKRIAFVDESSSSGYKFPFAMMILKWKIEPKTFFSKMVFVGNHPAVLQAVHEKRVDGGGVADIIYQDFPQKDTLMIIDQVENIPYDGIVASPVMNKETMEKIKSIFLQVNKLSKTKDGRTVLSDKMPFGGFAVKSESFYNIVRDTAKTIEEYETKK